MKHDGYFGFTSRDGHSINGVFSRQDAHCATFTEMEAYFENALIMGNKLVRYLPSGELLTPRHVLVAFDATLSSTPTRRYL